MSVTAVATEQVLQASERCISVLRPAVQLEGFEPTVPISTRRPAAVCGVPGGLA